MRTILKAAIVVFSVAGALAAAPAGAQPYPGDPYTDGYDGPDGYAYGDDCDPYYGCPDCDPYYGCPDDYYDSPLYYGQVYYDGLWFDGPIYYRDWGGHRQFWIRGGWRDGSYRGGHFGPALGRSWYQHHGVGRPGFSGGWNRGGYGASRPNAVRPYQGGRNFGGQAYRGQSFQPRAFGQSGGAMRGNGRGAPQSAPAFRGNAGGGHGGGFGGSHGGGGGHHR